MTANKPIDLEELSELLLTWWDSGWLPRDILGPLSARNKIASKLLVDAIASTRGSWHPKADPVWKEHADHIGAVIWWDEARDYREQLEAAGHTTDAVSLGHTVALTLVAATPGSRPVLHQSPHLPGDAVGGDNDTKTLDKVRGLLAKAESTTFPEEAEALSAKAQELITSHSIDLAILAADVDVPGGRRVYIEPPYARAKFHLLSTVAQAQGCEAVWRSQGNVATIVGYKGDLPLVDVLFTSLLVQGTVAILSEGSKVDLFGVARTKSWRRSFWFGYAERVGERLAAAAESVRGHAVQTNTDLLPVLRNRSEAVNETMSELFPTLTTMSVRLSNGVGLAAGRDQADKADLGGTSVAPARAALGS